jgi:hypothetical protein
MISSNGPVPAGDLRPGGTHTATPPVLTRVLVLGTVALLLAAGAAPLAQSCEPPTTVDLITGASTSGVIGVVEYEVIAENASSIGKSVAASRRIWGGVVADRWIVTAARSDCPTTPVSELGSHWYLLVGPGGRFDQPVFGSPSGAQLSDLEAGALASIVGEPALIEIGALDRAMAWMRVNWWLLSAGFVPVLAVVAVVRRRRSGARRDYLF